MQAHGGSREATGFSDGNKSADFAKVQIHYKV